MIGALGLNKLDIDVWDKILGDIPFVKHVDCLGQSDIIIIKKNLC